MCIVFSWVDFLHTENSAFNAIVFRKPFTKKAGPIEWIRLYKSVKQNAY